MAPRFLHILLGLSLLLNCFVLAGFVYRSWISPPTFDARMPLPPPPPPGGRPSPIEGLAHELDLDDAQRAALRGLFEQYAAQRRERAREIQKVREQTAAELRRPKMDLARVDGLVEQMARLRAEQQKENLRTVAQFEPQLRPEQRERLPAILAQRFLGPPPPPPPRPPGAPGGPPGPGGPAPGRPPQ